MRILVIGGTLFIGRRLVRELLRAGHEVTILHRNPKSGLPGGVTALLADRNDPESVRSAIGKRRFDAVFDNVYDWQRGTTADRVVATARACGDGLQRYVFMSSVAAFGSGLDHGDDDPLAAPDAPDDYVRNKAESERALFEMRLKEGLPAVTVRPPFIYGPENPFYREAYFWDRLADNRPILVPEDGSRLMQFVFVDDLVRVCLRTLDEPASTGRGINVGGPPITQLDAVRAFALAAGKEPNIRFISRARAIAEGGHPMGPKMYFAQYYDLPPITMRTTNMNRLLGIEPTPFAEGLRRTYEWWKARDRTAPDYSFDDRLLPMAAQTPDTGRENAQ